MMQRGDETTIRACSFILVCRIVLVLVLRVSVAVGLAIVIFDLVPIDHLSTTTASTSTCNAAGANLVVVPKPRSLTLRRLLLQPAPILVASVLAPAVPHHRILAKEALPASVAEVRRLGLLAATISVAFHVTSPSVGSGASWARACVLFRRLGTPSLLVPSLAFLGGQRIVEVFVVRGLALLLSWRLSSRVALSGRTTGLAAIGTPVVVETVSCVIIVT